MTCTNPQEIFDENTQQIIKVPCGKCLSCKKKRAAEWTIKLINEAKYHKRACFITLTFDDKKLTDVNSKAYKYGARGAFKDDVYLSKEYFKKFMKRLRKKFKDVKITFYHVGEHGERRHRAHHHAILYGIDFEEDRVKAEMSISGKEQWYSQTLEDLWAAGRTRIQLINANNIAYICGYSVKKLKSKDSQSYKDFNKKVKYVETTKTITDENGIKKKAKYKIDEETGEKIYFYKIVDKYNPIFSFSNRSKMNAKWFRKRPDCLLRGYLTDNDGKKYQIPRSYKDIAKNEDEFIYQYYYLKYLDKIEEYNEKQNLTDKEKIYFGKMKEKIWMSQMKEKPRADF